MAEIKKIKVLTSCRASGKSYAEGEEYSVPKDITAADAETLVKIGRAKNADTSKSSKKKEAGDNS